MENTYPRLRQLRAELEDCTRSPENDLSVLYAIRRELLWYYHEMPFAQLHLCPSELQDRFYCAQRALQKPMALPSFSASAPYAGTTQALDVLEQVTACTTKQEQLPA